MLEWHGVLQHFGTWPIFPQKSLHPGLHIRVEWFLREKIRQLPCCAKLLLGLLYLKLQLVEKEGKGLDFSLQKRLTLRAR